MRHDTETRFELALSQIGEESTVRSCLNAFVSKHRFGEIVTVELRVSVGKAFSQPCT